MMKVSETLDRMPCTDRLTDISSGKLTFKFPAALMQPFGLHTG